MIVAALRPDGIDLAVVVHVLGAMLLVGGVLTAATASLVGWRDESHALQRFSYTTLLAIGLPGYVVMRIGAEWAYAKEHLDEVKPSPTWIDIGYGVADVGGGLLLIALILGGVGSRRSRRGGGTALLKVSGVIAAVLLAAYVVVIWAMAGKPE